MKVYESALQDNQDEMIQKGLQEAKERKENADSQDVAKSDDDEYEEYEGEW